MADLDDVKIAELAPADIQTIKALEAKLGPHICLVAVERRNVLYVLEAKLAPNRWQRVDQVYPDIERLRAYFKDHGDAKSSKAALKSYLKHHHANGVVVKRPIRIRQIVNTES
jgi:hypothetical protein